MRACVSRCERRPFRAQAYGKREAPQKLRVLTAESPRCVCARVQDNEWTLGPRREPCGATTKIEMLNKGRNMTVTMVFEWYWLNNDEQVCWCAHAC